MSEPMVSILLPTIRPDLFRLRMADYAQLDLPWPCEIIVVSDRDGFEVPSPHPNLTMKFLQQPRLGTVAAMNLCFEASEGHYIIATNDEVEFHSAVLTALVREGEAQGEEGILSVNMTPWCSNDYYDILFATSPFGRRSYFQHLNGGDRLFDPAYACFYADPDLALRAHTKGVTVRIVPDALCIHRTVREADGHLANHNAYYWRDRTTFVTRWAHLGPPPIDPSLRS